MELDTAIIYCRRLGLRFPENVVYMTKIKIRVGVLLSNIKREWDGKKELHFWRWR